MPKRCSWRLVCGAILTIGTEEGRLEPPIYFGVAVWGPTFCESFVTGALASLLAEGNIPALSNNSKKNTFIIYTRKVDWEWLTMQAMVKLLQQYMQIEFIELAELSEQEYQLLNNPLKSRKLYLMTMGHRQIVNRMYAEHAIGSIIIVDSIYAKYSISAAYKHIAQGKTAVLVFCPRFATTAMIEELRERKYIIPGNPLALSSRELLAIAMRHQHLDLQMQEWDRPTIPEVMLETSWPLPNKSGKLFYTWSCWCAFVDYSKLKTHNVESLGNNTIDGVYWGENLTKESSHFITDSDEFTLVSFSSPIDRRRLIPIRRSFRAKAIMARCKLAFARQRIKYMMHGQTDPFKLWFANKPIYMHTKDLMPDCLRLKKSTQGIINKIVNKKFTMHDQILLHLNEPHLWQKVFSKKLFVKIYRVIFR